MSIVWFGREMMKNSVLFLLLICLFSIECLRIGKSSAVLHRFILLSRNSLPTSQRKGTSLHSSNVIISPFDESHASGDDKVGEAVAKKLSLVEDERELTLTFENVELVLDSMRPYLIADGGNVRLAEIDGPIVKLELQGACGSCPSSSMTMKMGLERKLKTRIPEIAEVIQTLPDAPVLNEENIENVLFGVRPFLAVAGGTIALSRLSGVGGLQPCVELDLQGTAAALQSVKTEIQQRIHRHFMASVKVEWKS